MGRHQSGFEQGHSEVAVFSLAEYFAYRFSFWNRRGWAWPTLAQNQAQTAKNDNVLKNLMFVSGNEYWHT